MSKKKSAKKRQKSPGVQKPPVRLSQAMIVKNEEKNIERALCWAKGYAFEQIVVDTGSTDKTAEIAEKLGAKVYHFEWADDFAAAKNYAMDQATGEWIAILDADEYMTREDAKKMMELLSKIQNDPKQKDECDAITCPFIDLDDNGNAVKVSSHQRIYRNRPYLRFIGRIHEAVKLQKSNYNTGNFQIFHTGYSKSALKDMEKSQRNITMLRSEQKLDPDNPDIQHYLANAILSLDTDDARAEAEELHFKALESKKTGNILVRQLAYDFLIPRLTESNRIDEAIEVCSRAIEDIPENIDYLYYRAVLRNKQGNYKAAIEDISTCETVLGSKNAIYTTRLLMPSPLPLFYQKTVSLEGIGDEHGVDYTKKKINSILSLGKQQSEVVGPYLRAMSWYGESSEKILKRLAELYDINDPRELMFIARSAKDSGAIDLARKTMEHIKILMDKE